MIRDRVIKQIKSAVRDVSVDIDVSIPENPEFGHYSTNLALKLAKELKKNPMEIAKELASQLEINDKRRAAGGKRFFEKIEAAPPGFINFWISQNELSKELEKMVKEKQYGKSDDLKGKKVMVEYTDPNPFKEFHIGHLYTNVIGESLARLFENRGAKVRRANYQGDVGIHVAKAIWGMIKKAEEERISLAVLAKKDLQERIKFMSHAYVLGATAFEESEEAEREITALNKKIYDLDPEIKELYQKGRKWSLEYFETIYKRLGTKFDFYYFERDVGKIGLKIVKENLAKGIFEESEGAVVFPGEKYGLHRRVFLNRYGLPTYEAKELGLAVSKYKDFLYDLSVVVTGSEIADYYKVVMTALRQIYPKIEKNIKHIGHGMVRFSGGKMSSRTGKVVTGESLLADVKNGAYELIKPTEEKNLEFGKGKIAEAVAIGAIKYSFLKGSIGQDIIFDFDKSLSLRGDSGPYLQYAYARFTSVLAKAGRRPGKIPFEILKKDSEKTIIRQLIYFPEIAYRASAMREPNILAEYLYKLANALNSFYEKEPIIRTEKDLRNARLGLAFAATKVLKTGLTLLGIPAPEKM